MRHLKTKRTDLNFTPARNHSQQACIHSRGKSTFNISLCCCSAQNKRTVSALHSLSLWLLLPLLASPCFFNSSTVSISLTVHRSIFPIQVRQMPLRNFRAVEWKWWKPQAGSHCKTPAPRLPAQTPSFRSTSWNWGCFLIKALVDWARLSRGCEGNFKVALDRYI